MVAQVAQAFQLFDRRDRIVGHEAADVEQAEPEVGVDGRAEVVRRQMVALVVLAHVVGGDLAEVADVEGAEVGQVEMGFGAGLDLRVES